MAEFGECSSRRRIMAGTLQPRTGVEDIPEIVQRESNPEAIPLRPIRGAAELRTEHNTQISKQVPRSEVALQCPGPRVPRQATNVRDPSPSEPTIPRGFLFEILTCRYDSTHTQEVVLWVILMVSKMVSIFVSSA